MKKTVFFLVLFWPLITMPISSVLYFYVDDPEDGLTRLLILAFAISGLVALEYPWGWYLNKSGIGKRLEKWAEMR